MTANRIIELVAEQFGIPAAEIVRETAFVDTLNADSLDIVELTMAIEEEFSISQVPEATMQGIQTVGDIIDYVEGVVGE